MGREPHLEESEKNVLAEMSEEEMSDAFYRKLSFGTAGMRGVMGLGTNRLNKYTIRMAAKGFAGILGEGARVAIAYDTRNHSDEFAKEAARVLAASGVKALLFDRYSPGAVAFIHRERSEMRRRHRDNGEPQSSCIQRIQGV